MNPCLKIGREGIDVDQEMDAFGEGAIVEKLIEEKKRSSDVSRFDEDLEAIILFYFCMAARGDGKEFVIG